MNLETQSCHYSLMGAERLVTWIAKVRESAPKCFSIALPTFDASTLQPALKSQSDQRNKSQAGSKQASVGGIAQSEQLEGENYGETSAPESALQCSVAFFKGRNMTCV